MAKIKNITAREILDSRGQPTIEVEVKLESGTTGRAAVPSGTSTGDHEAAELRDGEPRYAGQGVTKAVAAVANLIAPALAGADWDQKNLDDKMLELDDTPNKSKLGANAILAVSLAFARASAAENQESLAAYFQKLAGLTGQLKLPRPLILMIEGGRHLEGGVDFQEFMVIPHGAPNFREALRWGVEIYHAVGKILKTEGFNINVGLEGAYGPKLNSNEQAMEIILRAIEAAGYTPRQDVSIAIDVAADELPGKEQYTRAALVELYDNWVKKYPLTSIEDGLGEDDWEGWQELTAKLGNQIQLVGDDLFTTNIERLKIGVEKKAANAIIIKPNQIGTVSETLATVKFAGANNYAAIVSHRSGETGDAIIADLAVGFGIGQVKFGAPNRGERVAKYNQLLRLEESLATAG